MMRWIFDDYEGFSREKCRKMSGFCVSQGCFWVRIWWVCVGKHGGFFMECDWAVMHDFLIL